MISSRTLSKVLGVSVSPTQHIFSIRPSLLRVKPVSLPSLAAAQSVILYSSSAHRHYYSIQTMATATEIHLSPLTDSGVFTTGTTEDAARAASEVLQEDMENHHVFFNDQGFHST